MRNVHEVFQILNSKVAAKFNNLNFFCFKITLFEYCQFKNISVMGQLLLNSVKFPFELETFSS